MTATCVSIIYVYNVQQVLLYNDAVEGCNVSVH